MGVDSQSVLLARLRDPVVLKCPHSDAGKRTTNVRWFKSGYEIVDGSNSSSNNIKLIHSRDLFVRNVHEDDFGEYGCLLVDATNSIADSRMFYVLLEKAGEYHNNKNALNYSILIYF